VTVRIGTIATSAAPASSPTAGCGSNFAAGKAGLGASSIRLRRKPGLIELGRMRLRRGGGPLAASSSALAFEESLAGGSSAACGAAAA